MASIQKAYHNTIDGQLHYRFLKSTSSGKETTPLRAPIILLHMSASSSSSMEKMMLHLAALGHDTYAPDYPGFGSSFHPIEDPPNTAYYCQVICDFSKSLKLDKFHLFGHHSGACISVEMAVLYPENVLSVCLIGPALMSEEERMAMKTKYFEPFNRPVLDGSHLLKSWKYLEPHMPSPSKNIELLHRETLDNLRAWKGRSQIYATIWNQDCMDLFRRVRCPILCLIARDDVLMPFFHYVREVRADVEAVVLEGSGGDFEPDCCDGDIMGVYRPFLGAVG